MEWGLSKTAPLHSNRSTSCGQHVEEGVRQGRRRVIGIAKTCDSDHASADVDMRGTEDGVR